MSSLRELIYGTKEAGGDGGEEGEVVVPPRRPNEPLVEDGDRGEDPDDPFSSSSPPVTTRRGGGGGGGGGEKSAAKRKRARRRDDTVVAVDGDDESTNDENDEKEEDTTDNDEAAHPTSTARLDRLYAVPEQAIGLVVESAHHHFAPAARKRKSESEKKRHYARAGRPFVRNPAKNVEATPDDVRRRLGRRKREREWTDVRRRWRARRFDVRGEVDVGGALRRRVVVARQQQQKQKEEEDEEARRREAKKPSGGASSEEEEYDDDAGHVDTSEEEQEAILSQLRKSLRDAEEKRAAEAEEKKENDKSYHETMDYWELGLTAPRSEDPTSVSALLPVVDRRKRRRTAEQLQAPPIEEGLTLSTLPPKKPPAVDYRNDAFPLDHCVYARGHFTHQRQLLRVAARHIVGVAGSLDQGAVDSRLIRQLWHANVTGDTHSRGNPHRTALLLDQAAAAGRRVEFFLTHQWKDRTAAADGLGVSAEKQLVGPDEYIGYAMDQTTVKDATRNHIPKFFAKNSLQKLDWASADVAAEPGTSKITTCQTNYIPVAGTVPPVPSFPLDETQIVFGPKDKHADVMHVGAVDEVAYRLTLSSLLSRFVTAHVEDEEGLEEILRTQLHSIVQETVKLNQDKIYKRAQLRKAPIMELPLAPLYKAVMGYCSLIANGFPLPPEQIAKDPDDADSFAKHGSDLGTTVRSLVAFCEGQIGHNGLQMFSRLHITFALLNLAKTLPSSSAIEILSRPFDEEQCRTPFELVRHLLEHLEGSGQLVDTVTRSNDASGIVVGELEYNFHRAANIFAKCVERDPCEVDHHSWHIAFLAGSLLLCSGNRIGSEARSYPSSYTERGDDIFEVLDGEGQSSGAEHEMRRALPKFQELRRETATAFRLLAHLAKHQQGARTHLAVSSFLEWRQVLALLIGPVDDDNHVYDDVRSLHRCHAHEWALQDASTAALRSIQIEDFDPDTILQAIARTLENIPDKKEHWIALVRRLGTVGRRVPGEQREQCLRSNCGECLRLVKDLNIDHASLQSRIESGRWWGLDRRGWWYDNLLELPPPPGTPTQRIEAICSALHAEFESLDARELESAGRSNAADSSPSMEWLEDLVNSPQIFASEKSSPIEIRSKTVDAFLPLTYLERLDVSSGSQGPVPALELSGGNAELLEMLCYKALIVCHLYSVCHLGIQNLVTLLAEGSWNGRELSTDSDFFRCLRWLFQVGGLDARKILRESMKQS